MIIMYYDIKILCVNIIIPYIQFTFTFITYCLPVEKKSKPSLIGGLNGSFSHTDDVLVS